MLFASRRPNARRGLEGEGEGRDNKQPQAHLPQAQEQEAHGQRAKGGAKVCLSVVTLVLNGLPYLRHHLPTLQALAALNHTGRSASMLS